MAKYDVRVRYTFEGTYKVVAEDRDEAERIVTEDCGLVLGGNIHTTCDDDEVTDWRFTPTCRSFLSGNGVAKARSDTRPCVSATGLKN